MSPLRRRLLILLGSGLLFVCAFPLSYRHLEHFMYWTSLMSWPGYEPLLYWEAHLLRLALGALEDSLARRRFGSRWIDGSHAP